MTDNLSEKQGKFRAEIEDVARITGFTPEYVWKVMSGTRKSPIIQEAHSFYIKGKQTLIQRGTMKFNRIKTPVS